MKKDIFCLIFVTICLFFIVGWYIDVQLFKLVRDNEALKSINEQLCNHIDYLNKPKLDTVVDKFDGKMFDHISFDEAGQWDANLKPLRFANSRKYTQSEVDAMMEDTWKAARKLSMTDFHHTPYVHRAFSDYLKSLPENKSSTVDKAVTEPETKHMNSFQAYTEGFAHGVRHCEKYGIPTLQNLKPL